MKPVLILFSSMFILSACSKTKHHFPPPNALPDLASLSHDSTQCPKNIVGKWLDTNSAYNAKVFITYTANADIFSETYSTAGSSIDYDGTVHNDGKTKAGASNWHVGACQNGKLVLKIFASLGEKVTRLQVVTEPDSTDAATLKTTFFFDNGTSASSLLTRVQE